MVRARVRLLKAVLLCVVVSAVSCTFAGLKYVPPPCNDCTGRAFFENCCPVPPAPVIADRVELRWGPAVNDLDFIVLDSDGCLTSSILGTCPDTSLDVTTPGTEILTWSSTSKKYIIMAWQPITSQSTFPVDSEAEVRLYGKDGSVLTVNVPPTPAAFPDIVWTVGCFDGPAGLSSFTTVNAFDDFNEVPDCIPVGDVASPFTTRRAIKNLLAAKASAAAKANTKHHKRIQNINKRKNKKKNGE